MSIAILNMQDAIVGRHKGEWRSVTFWNRNGNSFLSYYGPDLQLIMSSIKVYFQTAMVSFENVSF